MNIFHLKHTNEHTLTNKLAYLFSRSFMLRTGLHNHKFCAQRGCGSNARQRSLDLSLSLTLFLHVQVCHESTFIPIETFIHLTKSLACFFSLVICSSLWFSIRHEVNYDRETEKHLTDRCIFNPHTHTKFPIRNFINRLSELIHLPASMIKGGSNYFSIYAKLNATKRFRSTYSVFMFHVSFAYSWPTRTEFASGFFSQVKNKIGTHWPKSWSNAQINDCSGWNGARLHNCCPNVWNIKLCSWVFTVQQWSVQWSIFWIWEARQIENLWKFPYPVWYWSNAARSAHQISTEAFKLWILWMTFFSFVGWIDNRLDANTSSSIIYRVVIQVHRIETEMNKIENWHIIFYV